LLHYQLIPLSRQLAKEGIYPAFEGQFVLNQSWNQAVLVGSERCRDWRSWESCRWICW